MPAKATAGLHSTPGDTRGPVTGMRAPRAGGVARVPSWYPSDPSMAPGKKENSHHDNVLQVTVLSRTPPNGADVSGGTIMNHWVIFQNICYIVTLLLEFIF